MYIHPTTPEIFRRIAIIIVVAVALLQGISLVSKYMQRTKGLESTVPANVSYQKAVDICGRYGISDLRWRNYEKGEIESIYCHW